MGKIGCKEFRNWLVDWWVCFNLFGILGDYVEIVNYRGEWEMFQVAKKILPKKEIEAREKLYALEKLSDLVLEPSDKDHPILLITKFIAQRMEILEEICTDHLKICPRCRNLAYFIDLYPFELVPELEEFIKKFWGEFWEETEKMTCQKVKRLLPEVIPFLFTDSKVYLNPLIRKIYYHCTCCQDCRHKTLLAIQAENERYRE